MQHNYGGKYSYILLRPAEVVADALYGGKPKVAGSNPGRDGNVFISNLIFVHLSEHNWL